MTCKHTSTLAKQAVQTLNDAKAQHQHALCKDARNNAYQREADGLAFKYLATCAQYGEHHALSLQAKESWLGARKAVQSRYPKPDY
ncbi:MULTISPECIES: hypothetical protein [Pseudoalteromonas]|uniref:Lysozyme inhibitor LprI N-terminal domain-containing protein n=1 Tax=Pseudoalteromonas amylolytica TaxID=1859457 RepID=A0A1S1MWH5_9GAMM|nr:MULTISPECIES: hypothetical protein [Pseudoalteromonas]OHU87809.1 hypothetical protein BFC16_10365 [Pseudoalteromonas sp. JW3]OHU91249.1 hypothetical protein BET10_10485 [Pseudoalteromonas amylolytica]